jgi:hypothetical protein
VASGDTTASIATPGAERQASPLPGGARLQHGLLDVRWDAG